jgi:hypothetical protein
MPFCIMHFETNLHHASSLHHLASQKILRSTPNGPSHRAWCREIKCAVHRWNALRAGRLSEDELAASKMAELWPRPLRRPKALACRSHQQRCRMSVWQYEHLRAFISYNCSTYDFIWYYMALKRYFSKIEYYSGLPVEVMDYKLWNPNTGNQAITRTIKNLNPIFAAEPSVPGVERQPAPAPPAYPSGHIWAHRLPNAATKTVWPVSNY